MNKILLKLKYFFVLILFSTSSLFAQVTIYTDDFESSTWSYSAFTGAANTSSNAWLISNQPCSIINNSLMVYDNTGPTYCTYNVGDNANKIAYHLITGTGNRGFTLQFDWKCEGEGGGINYDYATVCYCPIGSDPTVAGNWVDITTGGTDGAGSYLLQSATQTASIILPQALDNTDFYIGFRWRNDASLGAAPGFIVDNISITANPYCLPSYTNVNGCAADYISNVSFNTINNTSTCSPSPFYTYYNALSTNLTIGASYTPSFSVAGGTNAHIISAWIDYNQDLDFSDAGEKVINNLAFAATNPASATAPAFAVPCGATPGLTRMRIILNRTTNPTDPCQTTSARGEVEDYNVNIVSITASAGSDQTICGTSSTFSANTPPASASGAWSIVSGTGTATTPGSANSGVTGLAIGANTFKWTITSGTCSSNDNVIITQQAPPSIDTQPSNVNVCESSSSSFSVAASGVGLTYQWRKNGTDINDGGNISGSNTSSLIINPTNTSDAGNYDVIVSGTCPSPVTSSTASLTVETSPVITVPVSPVTVCENNNAVFSVTATGTALTYQWKKDGAALINGGNISGADLASLNIALSSAADQGAYEVEINGTCAPAVTSSAENLTVNQAPIISSNPVSEVICEAGSATFTVSTSAGTNLNYQWYKDATPTGGNSPSLTISPASTADNANYSVVISNTGCTAATSNTASLTVNEAPIILAEPISDIICEAGSTTFTVSTSAGTNLNYQWYKDASPIGINAASLTVNAATAADNGNYSVVISNTACTAATSNTASLTVNTSPVIATDPISEVICEAGSATFTVSTSAGTNLNYQWYKDATTTGGNSPSLTISPASTADNANYSVVVSNTGCTAATSNTASLTVNEAPIISAEPLSDIICEAGSTTFTVSTSAGTNLNYQWYKDASPIGINAASLTVNAATAADNGNYSVVISNTACTAATSNTASLTVNTSPVIATDPISEVICEAGSATFTVSTSAGTNLNYQWYKDATTTGGNSPSLTISPASTADNANYSVVVSNTGCTAATSNTASLTVNEAPIISAEPLSDIICEAGSTTFTVSTSAGTNLNYQWYKDASPIGINAASLTVNAATAADNGNYSVVISNTACTAATSNTASLTVNTSPVIATDPISEVICEAGSATFTVSTSAGTNLNYQWYKDATTTGGNSPSLTISPASTADNANYSVVVSNTGCTAATSNTASLTVNEAPIISAEPLSDIICEAGSTTFTVSTSAGTNLNYQWYKDASPIGINAASLTVNAATAADNGNYSVVISNTACTAATSNTASLTVNTSPVIATDPISEVICEAGSATFTVSTSAGTNLNYQWYKDATTTGGNSPSLTISPASTADNANYSVVVSNTGCTAATSNTASLTVNEAPIISAEPLSDIICEAGSTTFTVSTSAGTNLNYQWYKDASPIGINAASLTVNAATAADNGNYSVVISNTACTAATSNTASLTVNTSPVIDTDPISEVICEAGSATFTVSTSAGTNLNYQWYKDATPTGGNSPSLTISPASTADNANYSVVISNTGCTAATSNTASLTVNEAPIILAEPISDIICEAGSTTFTVSTSAGTNLNYQWYKDASPIGINAASLTVNAATAADNGNYSVVISNTACTAATSNTASLTVNTSPVIATDPISEVICEAGSATFTVSTSAGTNLNYQWYKDATTTGGNSPSLTISPASTADNANYSVVVSNTGCTAATSNTASLTVNEAPIISAEPLSDIICEAGSTTFTVSTSAGTNLNYQWYKDASPIGINAASLTVNAATAADNGNYSVVISNTACTAATSNTASLTVNTSPVIATDPISEVICEAGSATFTVSTSAGTNLNYQWYKDATTTGGNSPSLTISPASTADNANYSVVVSNTGCTAATSNTASLTVNEAPIISAEPLSDIICEAGSTTFTVSTSAGTNLNYQWYKDASPIGINAASLTVNAATAADNGNYSVVISNTACTAATSNTASLTVNTSPVIISDPASVNDCEGNPVNLIVIASSSTNANYDWEMSIDGGLSWIAVGDNSSDFSLSSAATSDNGNYRVRVSNVACPAATSASATLLINPLPDNSITASGPTNFCAGGTITLSASAVPGNIYQWSNSMTTDNIIVSSSGNYTLTVTDVNGCSLASTPVTVSVNSAPSQIITTNAGTAMCLGETMTLTADPSLGNTYIWSTTETTPSIIVNQSNSYFVTITNSFSCSVVSNPVTISVMPLPTVEVLPFDTTICQGTSIGLSAIGAISYQWLPTSVLDTAAGANVIASPTATTTYLITGTASNGCTSQTSRIISVREAPTAPVVSNNGPVCMKDSIKLYASIVNNAAYQWTGPAGFSLQLRDPSKIANTLADSGDYSLIITVDGCNSAPAITHVSVKPLPVANGSSNSPVCEGASLNLTANAVAGATYSWTGPNGFSTSDQNPTITNMAIVNSGTYKLYVTGVNGCSAEKVFSGTVKPLPNAVVFSDHGNTLCEGKSVQLSVIDGTSFTWSNGGNAQTITVSTPGSYRVTVNLNGCSKASDNFVIYQVPNPPVPIITEEQGLLMSSSTIGNKWYKDNDFIYNEVYQTYRPLQDGMYKVIATDENGCYSESAYYNFLYFPVGISSIAGMQSFNIFPNPASGTVNLAYSLDKPARVKVEITNLTGQRLLLHPEEKQEAGEQHILLNLENLNLTAGIYQILLSENGKTSSVRLIVNK